MGLFSNPLKASAPAAPKPMQYPAVPTQLPKISAPNAGQIAQQSQLSPAAQALVKPQQTPAQHLQAMQDQHLGPDMVKTLAHGMPDREGVHWAAQSAEKVSDKLPPHEVQAMKAAQAWAKNPTPANQAAAGDAAAQGGRRGPGSLAAQGAAWSQPATPALPGALATPRLTPHAVSGSVLMASALQAHPALAMPAMTAPAIQTPKPTLPEIQAPQLAGQVAPPSLAVPKEVQEQTFQQQHPFIAMGLEIAAGKTPVA
jgi:hypothetical protein